LLILAVLAIVIAAVLGHRSPRPQRHKVKATALSSITHPVLVQGRGGVSCRGRPTTVVENAPGAATGTPELRAGFCQRPMDHDSNSGSPPY
jgi:hypothetical protein